MALPPVTFSTLACPQWSTESVISHAREFGFDGLEWRGGDRGHINPNASRAQRIELRDRVRDANLFSLAVTGYTSFVSDDPAVRAANCEDLKRYLDLAADLNAKCVRAFLGELGPGQTLESTIPYIVESLANCISHAQAVGIGIAIEHHDDFVKTSSLVPLLNQLHAPSIGAVWDIANAYSAGEPAADGARNLHHRISYVQIKDGIGQHANWQLTNVGEGSVELVQAIRLLHTQNYTGAFSIEWEYAWHPELEPPERALPQALAYLRSVLLQTFASQGAAA